MKKFYMDEPTYGSADRLSTSDGGFQTGLQQGMGGRNAVVTAATCWLVGVLDYGDGLQVA